MIRKSWRKDNKYYDSTFDVASDNAWEQWDKEVQENEILTNCDMMLDANAFEKRFNCKPIIDNKKLWSGLIFKTKGDYVMFMLEWS